MPQYPSSHQELFDAVLHILDTGGFDKLSYSTGPDSVLPMYRSPDGTKCLVGHFIPDEAYARHGQHFEDKEVPELLEFLNGAYFDKWRGDSELFYFNDFLCAYEDELTALQVIYDEICVWYRERMRPVRARMLSLLRRRLMSYADEHGLVRPKAA